MKAKILLVHDYEIGDYENISVIKDSITDWEEISKEDLDFLNKNLFRINAYPYKAILILKEDETIQDKIASIKASIQKQLEDLKKEEKLKALRKKKRNQEQETKEKELFEKLKKKYEKK